MARRADNIRLAAWWKLLTAHAIMMQRVGCDLAAATGLRLGSFNVLRLLHKAPGGRLQMSELARAVHLTRSGVTRLANRLEKTGMLHREAHAKDRRSACAVLTERGRTEWKRARAVFVRSRRGALRKSPERRRGRDIERGPESNRDSRHERRLLMSNLKLIDEAEADSATRRTISPPNPRAPNASSTAADGVALAECYRTVRRCTETLCEPLATGRLYAPIHAGCEPGEVASGPHDMVFRNVPAVAVPARL